MSSDTPPSPDMGRPPVDTQAVSAPPPPPPGYLPPVYPQPAPSKGPWSKIVGYLFVASVLLNLYLLVAFVIVPIALNQGETVYRDGAGEDRVVILPVLGAIDDEMASYVKKSLRGLESNPPQALVLRINSGGGGVTASDQIWHAVTSFKQRFPEVSVVASFGGVAASGGYYIATPSDYIFCEQTGITGSIGVIAQIPSVQGMVDMLGVEMNTVVADGSERKAVANNLFENWRNEDGELTNAGKDNVEVLKNLLNSAWGRFVQVVDEGRPGLSTEDVESLATGDIFTASEALDNGLINEVGYLDNAVDKAIEMAGLDKDSTKVTVVRQGGDGILALLGASSSPGAGLKDFSADTVRTWMQELGEVRLAYRVQFN